MEEETEQHYRIEIYWGPHGDEVGRETVRGYGFNDDMTMFFMETIADERIYVPVERIQQLTIVEVSP